MMRPLFCGAACSFCNRWHTGLSPYELLDSLIFLDQSCLFVTMSEMFRGKGGVIWAGEINIKIISDLRKNALVTYIIRDQSFGKWNSSFRKP